jgi:hypothetical protein
MVMRLRYGPCTLETVHSDDMHCFSMNMTSVEDDIYYAADEKKTEEVKQVLGSSQL